jgi:XTP/dITP diphosphohydrolase
VVVYENGQSPEWDDPVRIAQASVEEAYRLLDAPVVKCDSGLQVPSLKGFPGPYSNYVERTLGVEGLLRVCEGLENREAAIYSVVAFCDEHLQPVMFYGETCGRLLAEKRGGHGYFFDFIFVPEGYRETLAEFADTERWKFWAGPYEEFAEWYTSRGIEKDQPA